MNSTNTHKLGGRRIRICSRVDLIIVACLILNTPLVLVKSTQSPNTIEVRITRSMAKRLKNTNAGSQNHTRSKLDDKFISTAESGEIVQSEANASTSGRKRRLSKKLPSSTPQSAAALDPNYSRTRLCDDSPEVEACSPAKRLAPYRPKPSAQVSPCSDCSPIQLVSHLFAIFQSQPVIGKL